MKRKLISLTLSSIIIFNHLPYVKDIYGQEKTKVNQIIDMQEENTKDRQEKNTKDIVYISDADGSTTAGDGTKESPYKNIQTALDNVAEGGTIRILGTIDYSKYKTHTDGSALPLVINKNVTIEGGNNKSPLADDADEFSVRAGIQLDADVTFRNIKLELAPQVILGKSTNQSNEKILGEANPLGATIFLAGNELTLDNINTRVGTSGTQDDNRPYISGGSFKNQGKVGNKAVLNVINPNEQTILSGIYAGDYWEERNLDVELNIDGKVLERKIYTGGIEKPLNGNVSISLGNKSTVYSFDTTNHNGNVNLNIEEYITRYDMDLSGINNLSLEENAKAILKTDSEFNVNNVTLKNGSLIDFRKMNGNPIVNGNFQGENTITNDITVGSILLTDKQTLEVKGEVLGTTNLNHAGSAFTEPLTEGHQYIKAKINSSGDFVIDPYMSDYYRLAKNTNDNNSTTWTVFRIKNTFKDFSWGDSPNEIIGTSSYDEHVFPIEFINSMNNLYIPYDEDWDEFEFTLTKADGTILDEESSYYDKDMYFYVSYFESAIILQIDNEEYTGEITLTARHKDTNKCISKKIKISKDLVKLSGTVRITGNPIVGRTICAQTSDIPSSAKNIKYSWYADDVKIDGQTGKELLLTEDLVGKNIKVEVEAENYSGSISSSEVLVKTSQKPVITAVDNITLNIGDIFEPLEGVSATDLEDGNITSKIEVSKNEVNTEKAGKYTVVYKVIDNDGNEVSKSITVTVKPEKVVDVGATSNGYNSNKVTWSSVADADGYEVYRAGSKTGNYTLRKTVSSGSKLRYINTELYTGKTYYYKVRSYKEIDGETIYGDFSSVVSAKPILGIPTVKAKSESYNSNRITWDEVTGASGYEVYRAGSRTGTYTLRKTVSSESKLRYINSELSTGKTYYYKVRAYRLVNDKKVYSDYSSIVSAKPILKVPTIEAKSASYNSNKITWDEVPGASGYEVYRAGNETGTYTLRKTVSSENKLRYINSELSTGKTYYYKVRAYRLVNDKKVYSDYSSVASAKPRLSTPSITLSTTSKKATVKWEKIAGAEGYKVYRAISKSGEYSSVKTITDGSTISYTNSKLTTGKTYYYKIRAYRTVNGKKVYSSYSTVRSIKVK